MPNRLASESSLYLRQHADNPVEWYPWGSEALALARRERRPILLSIGYSACHWCHVMAHESFEDGDTARVMNALFVNIKVDREERPDLDRIYQLAHQALTRSGGGWPLTVFLAPDDLLPFFAGTYFPPTRRYGRPAFTEVLQGVRRWFDQQPDQLAQQNAALAEFLAEHGRGEPHAATIDTEPLRIARERIGAGFDPERGGHRGSPKFPPCSEIELLQRLGRDGDADAARMAEFTLRAMAQRGLQDHLAGGFFRYCVDAHWGIPHFEKMLYDNAALLGVYAMAPPQAEFDEAADGIVAWLQAEMSVPGGGYASAIDADSAGEEGAYYLWTREQVAAVIPQASREDFFATYGLAGPPNFEGSAWHLQRIAPLSRSDRFRQERAALLAVRRRRVPPARDDKRLTGWNAMLVRALVRGAVRRAEPAWLELADRAIDALRRDAWRDGRLMALTRPQGGDIAGFLDDHAFLLDALLERLQAGWRDTDLDWAIALAGILLEDFQDAEQGGFYFTPHRHEALPQRPKPWLDDATPSGNAIAARALLRLGHLLGDTRYLDAAERTLRAAWNALAETPHGACTMLLALHEFLDPPIVVVLRATASEQTPWSEALTRARSAAAAVYVLEPSVSALRDKPHVEGGTAYVCQGMRCLAPAGAPEALDLLIAEMRANGSTRVA